jgi:Zn-finger domain-containing protein
MNQTHYNNIISLLQQLSDELKQINPSTVENFDIEDFTSTINSNLVELKDLGSFIKYED